MLDRSKAIKFPYAGCRRIGRTPSSIFLHAEHFITIPFFKYPAWISGLGALSSAIRIDNRDHLSYAVDLIWNISKSFDRQIPKNRFNIHVNMAKQRLARFAEEDNLNDHFVLEVPELELSDQLMKYIAEFLEITIIVCELCTNGAGVIVTDAFVGLRGSANYFVQRVSGNSYNAMRLNLHCNDEGERINMEIHEKLEEFKDMDAESRISTLQEGSSHELTDQKNLYTDVGEIYVTYNELQVHFINFSFC